MGLPGFMAELSLERSITNHHGENEYKPTKDRTLMAQGLPCRPYCYQECLKSPFNDEKCYRWCVNRGCDTYYLECEPSEPCTPCCPPPPSGCIDCPPPSGPPCTPGCGPCINGIRHCITEQCLGYAKACNVQQL